MGVVNLQSVLKLTPMLFLALPCACSKQTAASVKDGVGYAQIDAVNGSSAITYQQVVVIDNDKAIWAVCPTATPVSRDCAFDPTTKKQLMSADQYESQLKSALGVTTAKAELDQVQSLLTKAQSARDVQLQAANGDPATVARINAAYEQNVATINQRLQPVQERYQRGLDAFNFAINALTKDPQGQLTKTFIKKDGIFVSPAAQDQWSLYIQPFRAADGTANSPILNAQSDHGDGTVTVENVFLKSPDGTQIRVIYSYHSFAGGPGYGTSIDSSYAGPDTLCKALGFSGAASTNDTMHLSHGGKGKFALLNDDGSFKDYFYAIPDDSDRQYNLSFDVAYYDWIRCKK